MMANVFSREAGGSEAKRERHLRCDGVRDVCDVAMLVTAEEPAFCLRHFEHRALHCEAQVAPFDQLKASAHRIAVDRADDGLFKLSRGEWVGLHAGIEAWRAPIK